MNVVVMSVNDDYGQTDRQMNRQTDISDCRVTFATEKFILPANIEIILKFWVFTLGTRQNVYRCDRVSIELLSLLEFCWSVVCLLLV